MSFAHGSVTTCSHPSQVWEKSAFISLPPPPGGRATIADCPAPGGGSRRNPPPSTRSNRAGEKHRPTAFQSPGLPGGGLPAPPGSPWLSRKRSFRRLRRPARPACLNRGHLTKVENSVEIILCKEKTVLEPYLVPELSREKVAQSRVSRFEALESFQLIRRAQIAFSF